MTIGWAIVIIAVLWLVERHKLWKRAFMAAGVLLAVVLIAGAFFLVTHRREKQAAKSQSADWFEQNAPRSESQPVTITPDPVDCFDRKTGRLISDEGVKLGWMIAECGPNYIQKPAGQCKQLTKAGEIDPNYAVPVSTNPFEEPAPNNCVLPDN
jgi:hypothetical protein